MKQYKEFSAIKKNYKKFITSNLRVNTKAVKNFNSEQLEKHKGFYDMLTLRQQRTKTTTEKKKIIIDKLIKNALKNIEEFNNKCDLINQTKACEYIEITVEWKKSSVWGLNPHAIVWTNNGYRYGSASGCGYDKLSSAIASCLNEDYSILKRLYTEYEKILRKNKKANPHEFNYGAGYIYPYFEGGVGYSCFKGIFEKLGAKINKWNETKTSDFMYIEF